MWFAVACLGLIVLAVVTNPPVFGKDRLRLEVSESNRYLSYSDGTPFFYLGDTGWELFHRLDRKEADRYLTDRAKKGFTVIQAVVLFGIDEPNAYGDFPLHKNSPARPNEAYFQHVDFIVSKAESLGLYIGMLPAWGRYWKKVGPYDLFDPENARTYGEFLGKRYPDAPIIWILGGDQNIESKSDRQIIQAMAEGLQAGDGGAHLMTYHPRGRSTSSDYFHDAEWLDFNMLQSGHTSRNLDNGTMVDHDYALMPPKPTLDGEPRYECIPVRFARGGHDPSNRMDAYDVRRAAYWSLLAGACGFTYGNNNVWQMWEPEHRSAIHADIPWYEALDHPGAFQMGLVRRLFESRPYQKLAPSQKLVKSEPVTGGKKIRAAVARDGSFAFIYSPGGEKFSIDNSTISAPKIRKLWYNPRYGNAEIFEVSEEKGVQEYTPPTSGKGNDWVLILEDTSANFPMP